MQRIDLVAIDFQYDFCDPKGALYVKGAEEDVKRLSNLIRRLDKKISNMHLTLDSHHALHIAHPVWFLDKNNQHPQPFTIITADDVHNGTWRASKRGLQKRTEEYVDSLKSN